MPGILSKIFGSHSDRELRSVEPLVKQIESYEDSLRSVSDTYLREKTEEFKKRLAAGETLDDILPEAFAVAREACDRVLGMRPYRVQLIGGIVLHQGRIAEMKTGEGKTLVAVMPSYLNALAGRGVHIVTVNDYLARRDSEWMGKVHRFLGLTVGLIIHDLPNSERKISYASDITYGTNNEMGFDYLRDNMALRRSETVQRGHNFAIVDEVDSILIDEARTPLIISGQGDESTEIYQQVDDFVSKLQRIVVASTDEKKDNDDENADYIVDEKSHSATLTSRGIEKAEKYFELENLSDLENSTLNHHINQALKAHGVKKRDIDYIVSEDNEVVIVDEFTGRLMLGRRYNEGLHQAIEAKEHVTVAHESKTHATITFQNYFRLYEKLSGMTGTAMTEEEEFGTIYKLDIIEIPTNVPVIRKDSPDSVYKGEAGKYRAIIAQIEECQAKGQPVLVGTVSIEKSELLSGMLRKNGIKHNVLNAKNHQKEAEIVAQAGKFGFVTIATNMAGRGTDIKLGGNPEYLALSDLRKAGIPEEIIAEADGHADTGDADILSARAMYTERLREHKKATDEEYKQVIAAGGLFIVGTERHESRRIDNQLRGRSGRQGDPGASKFFISMTDDVMRLFGSERIIGMMDALKIDEDMPIDQKILSNAIESAQRKIESRNFQTRKNVLEYDDVMNTQRKLIYEQRGKVLDDGNVRDNVLGMVRDVIDNAVPERVTDQSVFDEIVSQFEKLFLRKGKITLPEGGISKGELTDQLYAEALAVYDARERAFGLLPNTETPVMRELERINLLRVVDEYWMEHLEAMDDLQENVRLKAYAQANPVDEYKREGFEVFEEMIESIKEEVTRRMFLVQIRTNQSLERKSVSKNVRLQAAGAGGDDSIKKEPVRAKKKPGPNEPCWCGKLGPDGKVLKYKKCHMDADRLGA